MGMAASQARYLALVARQSNCEYEGQQINQARTVLSNQSANLFNQMLGLKVPVPPSVQNFTKVQYSFKDGENAVTIDSWKQLANPEENFNYTVKYHYYSDVYTGSQKKMNDPQVQMNTEGKQISEGELQILQQKLAMARSDYDKATKAETDAKKALDAANSALASANLKKSTDEANLASVTDQIATLQKEMQKASNYQDDKLYAGVDSATRETGPSYKIKTADGKEHTFESYSSPNIDPAGKKFIQDNNELWQTLNKGESTTHYAPTSLFYNKEDGTIATDYDLQNAKSYRSFPVMHTTGDQAIDKTYKNYSDQLNALQEQQSYLRKSIAEDDVAISDAQQDCQTKEKEYQTAQTETQNKKQIYDEIEAEYSQYQSPSYIGNCKLTLLESLDVDNETELKQIVKDMIAQDIDANIINNFDADGNYKGGIYKFTYQGNDYYTTLVDLYNSYNSGNQYGNNNIDAQIKLPYYNASYVSTKIEEEKKALLETDGNGRFTSVRFEDDTMKYNLSMETITDELAYEDAMNQYYYENAKYDKIIQDINAKTSLIQQEDLQLELRLKQLDTERNAMVAEIEAVQKIVKDNVDKSFKTFSG